MYSFPTIIFIACLAMALNIQAITSISFPSTSHHRLLLNFAKSCTIQFSWKKGLTEYTYLHTELLKICSEFKTNCVSLHTTALPFVPYKMLDVLYYQQVMDHRTTLKIMKPAIVWFEPEHLFPIYFSVFSSQRFRTTCLVQVTRFSPDLGSKASIIKQNYISELAPYSSAMPGAPDYILIASTAKLKDNIASFINIAPLLRPILLFFVSRSSEFKEFQILTTCSPCNENLVYYLHKSPKHDFTHLLQTSLVNIPMPDTKNMASVKTFWNSLHRFLQGRDPAKEQPQKSRAVLVCNIKHFQQFAHNCTSNECMSFFSELYFDQLISVFVPDFGNNLNGNMTSEVLSYGTESQRYKYTIAKVPETDSPISHLANLLKPIPFIGWTFIGVIFAALAHILKKKLEKGGQAFWITAVLLEQGDVQGMYHGLWASLLIVIWTFTGLLIRNSYTSTMFSYISKKAIPDIPQSIDEIRNDTSFIEFHFRHTNQLVLDRQLYLPNHIAGHIPSLWTPGVSKSFALKSFSCTAYDLPGHLGFRGFFRNISKRSEIYCIAYDHYNKPVYKTNLGTPRGLALIYNGDYDISWLKFVFQKMGKLEIVENPDQSLLNDANKFLACAIRHFFSESWNRVVAGLQESGVYARNNLLNLQFVATIYSGLYYQNREGDYPKLNYGAFLFPSNIILDMYSVEIVNMTAMQYVLLLYMFLLTFSLTLFMLEVFCCKSKLLGTNLFVNKCYK